MLPVIIFLVLAFLVCFGLYKINSRLKAYAAEELAENTVKPVWFYRTDDKNIGPLSHNDIVPLINNGTIKNETLAWKIGLKEWKYARELFHESFKSIPPPVPNVNPIYPQAIPIPSDSTPLETIATPKTGLAIASLICGIIGGAFSVVSIPAVICGHVALFHIKNDPVKFGGRRMALAGLILGYIAIALSLILGTMKGILWAQLIQMGY